jgi:hypothetical protein
MGINRSKGIYAKAWREARKRQGLCLKCGVQNDSPQYNTCTVCRKKNNERVKSIYWANPALEAERSRLKRLELKQIVFNHYGQRCACTGCDTTNQEFLQVDHINGGGHQHRKTVIGARIYEWLIKNKFPDGYRLLCANCNWSRGIWGYCPHEKEKCLY